METRWHEGSPAAARSLSPWGRALDPVQERGWEADPREHWSGRREGGGGDPRKAQGGDGDAQSLPDAEVRAAHFRRPARGLGAGSPEEDAELPVPPAASPRRV